MAISGYFGLGLLLSSFLAFVCGQVGEILDKVEDLTDEVVAMYDVADEVILMSSGKGLPEVIPFSEAKNQIVHHLTTFNGFSAESYFTVNKELLTAILSNFVTYLIILLQFRVGENSSGGEDGSNSSPENVTVPQ